uniref:hypothetical protein n=1 Tax=Polynucleobacter sp. TaxID=2029855 RepID=UPI004048857E
MEMKLEMVPVDKLTDAYSGVSMIDSAQTVLNGLSKSELDRYGKAMNKIERRQTLNIKDLNVLDKIDKLTFEAHGMCLKDSLVTKARIKACKKYGLKFIDRNGLVDHMNQVMSSSFNAKQEELSDEELKARIGCFIMDRLGENRFQDFLNTLERSVSKGLDIEDLQVLSEVEYFTCKELGFSIFNSAIQKAINEACIKYGFKFDELSKETIH